MKPIGYIFLGIVIGVALTLTAAYILAAFSRPAPVQDKTLEALNKVMDKELESLLRVESVDTNYYNIETKKGTVVLFTGMTKEEVSEGVKFRAMEMGLWRGKEVPFSKTGEKIPDSTTTADTVEFATLEKVLDLIASEYEYVWEDD
ncbi:MAG: hypothetical protein J6U03_05760 [Muribaculaceae bacterium]|nr:hypothetical protein [Muribaculaceae bacterium]